jgi:hypothetical protein
MLTMEKVQIKNLKQACLLKITQGKIKVFMLVYMRKMIRLMLKMTG